MVTAFVCITIFTTIAVAVSSYLSFSGVVVEELTQTNALALSTLSRAVDRQLVERLHSIYLDALPPLKNGALQQLVNGRAEGNNNARYYVAATHLEEIQRYNSDIVSSVFLYLPDDDLVIASPEGISYIDSQAVPTKDFTWLSIPADGLTKTQWIGKSPSMHPNMPPMLVCLFPYNGQTAHGVFGIAVQHSYVEGILRQSAVGAQTRAVLVDNLSRSVASTAQLSGDTNWAELSAQGRQGAMHSVNGVRSVVSSVPISATGFTLITWLPADDFFRNVRAVRQTAIIVASSSLLMGLLLSVLLSSRIYHPLASLLQTLRGRSSPRSGPDEVGLINGVIDELSVKVRELEQTLQQNQPIIKHNYVTSFMGSKTTDSEELAFQLRALGVSYRPLVHICAVFRLNASDMAALNVENRRFAPMQLQSEIERFTTASRFLFAAQPDDRTVFAVGISMRPGMFADFEMICQDLCRFMLDHFRVFCSVGISLEGKGDAEAAGLYAQCVAALRYAYFAPGQHIFAYRLTRERDACPQEVPASCLAAFQRAFEQKDELSLHAALDAFVRAMSKTYSCEACERAITSALMSLGTTAHANGAPPIAGKEELYRGFSEIGDVLAWEGWVAEVALQLIGHQSDPQGERNRLAVEKVCAWLLASLDKPLSVSEAAHFIDMSPRRFCTVFKEQTGHTFADYVTALRMDAARALLVSSHLPVDEIYVRVGYNSASYFIRVFKQFFGETPANYRHRAHIDSLP